MPRPDFPTTLPGFFARFPDDRSAFEYLVAARWPGGKFECPRCAHGDAYAHEKRMILECKACRYQASATAGTVMHRSKMPLRTWLLAAWMVITDKRGLSAKQLQRQIGCGYETAYMMLQKLRAGMVAPDREKLSGTVEVDETFIGSPKRGRPEEEAPEKMLVVGAVEVRLDPKSGRHRAGRVRFRQIRARTETELLLFVGENVEPGSVVVTDGLKEYGNLKQAGYRRSIQIAGRGGVTKADVLRHFHLAVSNLKAWLLGTHHGAVSKKHLQAYLNEFAFRFNRRGNLYAGFQRVLGIGTTVAGPTYSAIYTQDGEPGGWAHPNPPGRSRSRD